ncbi:MAG: amidohydrolase family protein [Actinobacteria bacterium]|nr:amidohydrolase family protein [Actinomycetota bacterium]
MIIDGWVNLFPASFGRAWSATSENRSVGELFGGRTGEGSEVHALLADMDEAGVDRAILTPGLSGTGDQAGLPTLEEQLAVATEHAPRFGVAPAIDRATSPMDNARHVRDVAAHDPVVAVRVTPLVEQYPLNHRLYYPVYAACEEAGLPVTINIGVPGPRVRSECQDPRRLEDVLIDFPDLVVVGAHMGHPYEALLIQYLLKWPNLYLMTSAYLATYLDERLARFMNSSRGRGRVLFASDHPVIPLPRALTAAREVPLEDDARAAFLGDSAGRVFFGL